MKSLPAFRFFAAVPKSAPVALASSDDYFILISSYTQFKNKAQQSAMMAKEIGETAGGDKKSEHYQNHYYNCNNDSMEKQGNTSDYLTARIARDDPQVYADMLKGKYRSVRAAAIDAGIVDPEKTRRCNSNRTEPG